MTEYKSFASSLISLVGQANDEKKSLRIRALVHRFILSRASAEKDDCSPITSQQRFRQALDPASRTQDLTDR